MLRRLSSRLTYANVMSTIAVVVAVGTGGAYAANTIGSTDIIDGEVKSVDVGNGEIGSNDIKDNSVNTFDVHSFLGVDVVDGTLTGADIENGSIENGDVAQNTFDGGNIVDYSLTGSDIAADVNGNIRFTSAIGTISPNTCAYRQLTDLSTQQTSHMLLTPSFTDASSLLDYSIETGDSFPHLKICNPTSSAQIDANTTFNLLVIPR